jgi:hypothetical protein
MEKYFLTWMSWPETILQGVTAALLIWNSRMLNYIGIILFVLLLVVQIVMRKRKPNARPDALNSV